MSGPTEYRIETMADMLKVPEDKWPEMLADLATWLDIVTADSLQIETDTGRTAKIAFDPVFIWIDDGLREVQSIWVNGERFDRDPDRYTLTEAGRKALRGED